MVVTSVQQLSATTGVVELVQVKNGIIECENSSRIAKPEPHIYYIGLVFGSSYAIQLKAQLPTWPYNFEH